MFDMPSKMQGSEHKTELLALRVTRPIKEAVIAAAQDDGVDVSEWLRSLIVGELRRRGVLSNMNCSDVSEEGNMVER